MQKVGETISTIEASVLPHITEKIGERYYTKQLESEAKTLARNRLIKRMNADPDKMAKRAEIIKDIVAEVKESGVKGSKEVTENFIKILIGQVCEMHPKNKTLIVLK